MPSCHCTNQCPGCGSCCQIACGCQRRGFRPFTYPSPPIVPTTTTTTARPLPTGAIKFVPQAPLTEEALKRILKEAFAEALEELRKLKGGEAA